MHGERRERFPRHRRLAIPTCIMARASRTCRDACRDRYLAVSFEVGARKYSRYMHNPQFYVSGKRPMEKVGDYPGMKTHSVIVSMTKVSWRCCLANDGCVSLQRRHNERDGVSNHRRLDCLLKSKKTSKLRITSLCEGNSPATSDRWIPHTKVTRKMFPFHDAIM